MLSPFECLCGNFILPEPASYVFFYAVFNLRKLLYIIRTRSHHLIVRGAVFESIVPEAKNMTDEEAAALLRLALTSEPAREFLRKRAEETTS